MKVHILSYESIVKLLGQGKNINIEKSINLK